MQKRKSDFLKSTLHARPYARRTCLFSVKFSRTGSEILAGSNDDALYVYDLARGERILRVSKIDDHLPFGINQFNIFL